MNKLNPLLFLLRCIQFQCSRQLGLWIALATVLALAGCGQAALATPTAIPADVVRPVQPTPVYTTQVDVFTLATPQHTPVLITPTPTPALDTLSAIRQGPAGWRALLAIEQPPSALGIATAGAVIYDQPGGRVLKQIPPTGVLNVTGISADGRWLSVYDDDAVFGWTPAGQLSLFGADDLTVVDKAVNPGVAATLIAEAMEPVRVLDDLMATLEATPEP
jgi:predicted small lipoprotein YifL